jgi:predicted alpha/beta hydrolase
MISENVFAKDGTRIAAQFHFPENGKITGAVLIAPAMSAPQSYYQPFAEWLAREGYLVATFDYRGTGESREGGFRRTLRGYQADILDWAKLDCGAMLEALSARAPQLPLYWVGHSLGGQILGFLPDSIRERIAKAITVATGSGYWLENAAPLKKRAWWLWFVVAPLATALYGYFPGAKLRKVGDLPKGVMQQWRRWCLNKDYAVGDGEHVRAQFAAVRTPIVSLSFQDDELMSARNTESIHGFYVNAPRTMKRIAPQEIGARRIGHFGFFRREFSDSLWRAHLLPELAGEHRA